MGINSRSKYPKINPGEVVGVIGDTHIPYERKGYLEHCACTFEEHEVNRVIHIGDLIDHHALSFHDSEPLLRGAEGELEDARCRLQPWFDVFPKLELIEGNHDAIPGRQLRKIGMAPEQWMRSLGDVYDMPKGWDVVPYVYSNGVHYHHGETALGVNGFRNDSRSRFCNTVSGHAHGNAGVSYTATDHRLVYGCAVGCGVDVRQRAFAYGRHFGLKPIVSCAVILDDGRLPVVFPMALQEKP